VLLFGANTLIMLIISTVLFAITWLKGLVFGSAIQNYMDFVSLTNISMLILDSKHHGYYVHGENNAGSSEHSVEEFNQVLVKESKGYFKTRGLLSNDKEELQSFEVFLPIDFQYFFNSTFKVELKAELAQKLNRMPQSNPYYSNFPSNKFEDMLIRQRNPHVSDTMEVLDPQLQQLQQQDKLNAPVNFPDIQKIMTAGRNSPQFRRSSSLMGLNKARRSPVSQTDSFGRSKGLPLNLDFTKIFEQKRIVEDVFKSMLNNISSNKDMCLEKSAIHKVFGIPSFDVMSIKSNPLFFKDKELFIGRCLFFGIEKQTIWISIILFNALDFLIQNPFIAAVIVWLVDFLRHELLSSIIQNNFSRSSLINEAFLA